jgi:hypothetical protein
MQPMQANEPNRGLALPLLRWLLCICLCACGNTFAQAAAPDLLTPEERAWLVAHPRIVLGAAVDWADAITTEVQGNLSGFDALLGGLLGGGTTGGTPAASPLAGLGSLLDLNGDGNALDDILGWRAARSDSCIRRRLAPAGFNDPGKRQWT